MLSVAFVDGTYYTPEWVPILTPLTQAEKDWYMSAVERAERTAGRKLTQRELIRIVDLMEGKYDY